MRLFAIDPHAFSLLVSSYTFAAAASGFVAAFWIDRFDHKRALLVLYGGFIVATALCGLAPSYPLLLAARIVAGAFGGVTGGLVLAIVADLVPFSRRATATAIVAASFSLAAVAGVPAGPVDRRALHVAHAVPRARGIERRRRHRRGADAPPAAVPSRACGTPASARAAARDLRRAQPPARVRVHADAHVRGLHRDPVHRAVQRRQRRPRGDRPADHVLRGRPRDARHLAPDRPARRPLRQEARVRHRRRPVDRADPDHDAPDRRPADRRRGVRRAVLRARHRPLRPGHDAVTGSAAPRAARARS